MMPQTAFAAADYHESRAVGSGGKLKALGHFTDSTKRLCAALYDDGPGAYAETYIAHVYTEADGSYNWTAGPSVDDYSDDGNPTCRTVAGTIPQGQLTTAVVSINYTNGQGFQDPTPPIWHYNS